MRGTKLERIAVLEGFLVAVKAVRHMNKGDKKFKSETLKDKRSLNSLNILIWEKKYECLETNANL